MDSHLGLVAFSIVQYMYVNVCIIKLPVVPHKAVAEVSKIGHYRGGELVIVMHGWQSESTDGPKGGWSCVFWTTWSVTSPTTARCSVV